MSGRTRLPDRTGYELSASDPMCEPSVVDGTSSDWLIVGPLSLQDQRTLKSTLIRVCRSTSETDPGSQKPQFLMGVPISHQPEAASFWKPRPFKTNFLYRMTQSEPIRLPGPLLRTPRSALARHAAMYDNVLYHMYKNGDEMARVGTKVKVKSISLSLTGGGVGWEVDATELMAVKKLIAFLEDRRVLYNPPHLEVQRDINISIDDIRSRCTDVIGTVDEKSPAAAAAREIRKACRKFLDNPRPHIGGFVGDDASFVLAIGEFRAAVGIYVAALAGAYQIEVEQELANIMPSSEKE